jgi:hypothetical protein
MKMDTGNGIELRSLGHRDSNLVMYADSVTSYLAFYCDKYESNKVNSSVYLS